MSKIEYDRQSCTFFDSTGFVSFRQIINEPALTVILRGQVDLVSTMTTKTSPLIIKTSTFGTSASVSPFGGTNKAHATFDPVPGVPENSTDRKPLAVPTQSQEQIHDKAHAACYSVLDVPESSSDRESVQIRLVCLTPPPWRLDLRPLQAVALWAGNHARKKMEDFL